MKFSPREQIQTYRTLAGPSWRWKLAQELARSKCSWPGLDDQTVLQTKTYFEKVSDGGEAQAAQQFPKIAAARMLWQDAKARQSLMILTLGDVTQDEIAKRLTLPVQFVAAAELLFFDVRDRLDASSWIMHQVISPAERVGDLELATMYRTALWGGPLVAQKIIDTEGRVSFDGVKRLADQEFRLGMKAQAALDIPLDSDQAKLRYTKMYLEYECAKRRLELQKAKFRDRCEREIRKQELAERRIDAKFQREETARQREQGVQHALARQQQAAKEQAANSPLTQLTWSRSAEFGSDVSQQPKAAQPQQKLTDRPRRKIAEVAA